MYLITGHQTHECTMKKNMVKRGYSYRMKSNVSGRIAEKYTAFYASLIFTIMRTIGELSWLPCSLQNNGK